ncbi:hypothetical protein BDV06DRAFT_24483 [Aspergillus oleicola]
MPAKHHPPEPESPNHGKQDPTERRRLQNRLSQRNHRRKIRDRIAKLQERVIASELRAAATLHGWHTPCIPYEVKPSPSSSSSTSSSVSLPPPTSSPPNELQCSSASYNVGLGTLPQIPMLSTTPGYNEVGPVGTLDSSGTSSPTTTSFIPDDAIGSGTGTGAVSAMPGQGLGIGLDTMQMCEQWGFQGSVYLATETSLPSILQTLGPSSNAIIVLPTPGYTGNALGYNNSGQMDMGACQCQGLGWMNCHLHSMG